MAPPYVLTVCRPTSLLPIATDAPFLALWYVKVAVLLLFLAYAILCFIGIYRLTYGQPLSDLAPDGSYLQKYDAVNQVSARPRPAGRLCSGQPGRVVSDICCGSYLQKYGAVNQSDDERAASW